MIALMRSLCAAINCVATILAVFAAAVQMQALMAALGLVAAIAATAWGLLIFVYGDEPETHTRQSAEFTTAAAVDEYDDELPYRPSDHRPWWDTTVFGAPE